MNNKLFRKGISLLLATSMLLTLAGCSGEGTAGSGDPADADNGYGDGTDLASQEQAAGNDTVIMGRYVEEEIDLAGLLSHGDASRGICRRADGSLVILNTLAGFVISEDEGSTWRAEMPEWLSIMQNDSFYVSDMDMAPDGTVAVLYDEDDASGRWEPKMQLILSDGTQVPVEAELTEEEKYFTLVAASGDGRIFASTAEGSVYEIHKDGSTEKLFAPEAVPNWMKTGNSLLFLDSALGYGTMPQIYDLRTGTYVEDSVLQEFVESVYGDRNYKGRLSQSMYLLPGEEQTVYAVGSEGIHRHVIGGNMMEQVVDGSLSMLSSPNYFINSAIRLEGDIFLVLFSNGKLLRFTYNPDITAVPENTLKVYSLKEDSNLRQAIAGYQSGHPDVYVSYEIGMPEGSAVTREDAVKKLNTAVMAGTGPDLLVMDDLPIRSYAEKGLLLDLADHLTAYSAQEPLFENIIDALAIEGKAYMVPAAFDIPMLIGEKRLLENITGMSDMADLMETMREQEPGADIIGITGERGILSRFASVSAPAWIGADGQIDRQMLGEFLEQCRRICDAQLDGLDDKILQKYAEREISLEALRSRDPNRDWQAAYALFDLLSGSVRMVNSWVGSVDRWIETVSIDRASEFGEYRAVELKGQCSGVFRPKTLLAVSTVSGQSDAALSFLDHFLSVQAQSGFTGFPVNQNAFDILFTPKEGSVDADGGYSHLGLVGEDGNEMQYTCYWPADERVAAFKEQLAGLRTAYVPDSTLEEAVFEQGVAYLQGRQTLEQTLDEIEKKVAIYMAE